MPKFLDGLMPMVISLAIWSWGLNLPITMGVVLSMAAATCTYQGIKLFLKPNNSQETYHG